MHLPRRGERLASITLGKEDLMRHYEGRSRGPAGHRGWKALIVAAVALCGLVGAGSAGAKASEWITISKDFTSPLFGLSAKPGGPLFVADSGAGPTELRNGKASLIADLPGVTDVLPVEGGRFLALTSGGPANALYRISRRGHVEQVADLLAFEKAKNPDGDEIESNPFDLAKGANGKTLVADAAGNDILRVGPHGHVDWAATLPEKLVSTRFIKKLVGCPNPADPEEAEACSLPPQIPADPVATSVAVGPDGAMYVTELRGFPATPGTSRVWRIEPDAYHVHCGTSPKCKVVARGFTSIIDLAFGKGKAYVVELDEKSWYAVETGRAVGGTINVCRPYGSHWDCHRLATHLPMPTAVALKDGGVYTTLFSLVPGQARVVRLH